MIYPHMVKFNGVYYPAGTDVPNETKGGGNIPTPSVSGKVEAKEEKSGRKYSEKDLSIPYMKLKKLAKEEGFKVENTMKADELKEMLRSL